MFFVHTILQIFNAFLEVVVLWVEVIDGVSEEFSCVPEEYLYS